MNRTLLGIAGAASLALTMGLGANPAAALPSADLWYTTTGAGGWIEINSSIAITGGGAQVVGSCPLTAASDPACGTGSGHFSASGFTINVNASTNGPGTASLADTTNASINVIDNHTDGLTHDIWFVAGGSGFTMPLGNTLKDTNSGTTVQGVAGGSVSAFACIRLDNMVDNTHSCDSAGNLPDFITPTQSGAIPAGPSTSWSLPDGSLFPVSLTSPYALIDEVRLTLKNGEQVTFTSNATVFPVPEPASLAIFGTALLGFGLIRRRRQG